MKLRFGTSSLAGLAWVAGCATDGTPSEELHAAGVGAALTMADSRQKLGPEGLEGSNGLLILKWVVADSSAAFGAAFGEEGNEWALDARTRAAWARNGVRIYRVPADHVECLSTALGGATVSLREWCGQMIGWRDLLDRSIGADGRAVAVDGSVRCLDQGSLQLAARGWTIMDELGPRFHLELAVQHVPFDTAALWPAPQGDEPARELFHSMMAELDFEAGFAYVLTCESPQVEWSGAPTPEAESSEEPNRPVAEVVSIADDGASDSGPDVLAPLTLGETMLLSEAGVPRRGVIVFVPCIPASWSAVFEGTEPDQSGGAG